MLACISLAADSFARCRPPHAPAGCGTREAPAGSGNPRVYPAATTSRLSRTARVSG
jgi:hypothetical protein